MEDKPLKNDEFSCSSIDELPQIAKNIFSYANGIKVWLFVGELGAGKTTLIKELCKFMGVIDEVSSPTFSIINEYMAQDKALYHFDFYRLKNEQEGVDIGVMEYFDSGAYCFIEWPQKIQNLLPDEFLMIDIESLGSEKRVFKLRKYE